MKVRERQVGIEYRIVKLLKGGHVGDATVLWILRASRGTALPLPGPLPGGSVERPDGQDPVGTH